MLNHELTLYNIIPVLNVVNYINYHYADDNDEKSRRWHFVFLSRFLLFQAGYYVFKL